MKTKFIIAIVFLFTFLSSCEKEEISGEVRLVFKDKNLENFKIAILPIELYNIDFANTAYLREMEPDENGVVLIKELLPGTYFWYDYGSRKGIFQFIEGKSLKYEYYLWPVD